MTASRMIGRTRTGKALPAPSDLSRANARLCAEREGPAGHAKVLENDNFRWLEFDNGVVQSALDRSTPDRLVLPYTWWSLAVLPLVVIPRQALLLGLGGGSLARFAMAQGVRHVAAVDLDPVIAELASSWFECQSAGVDVHIADARTYLADADKSFDWITSDLFTQRGMPRWIRQAAFYDLCEKRLTNRGCVAVNVAPIDDFELDEIVQAVHMAFGGRVLRLRVPDTGNYIVFGFKARPRHAGRATLVKRAAGLEARLQLPFSAMLNALYASNPSRRGELIL